MPHDMKFIEFINVEIQVAVLKCRICGLGVKILPDRHIITTCPNVANHIYKEEKNGKSKG